MRLILLTLLALALLPATAAAQDAAVTGPPQAVGTTTATLTGTVDPDGTARDYRFEYGTTVAYGSRTTTGTSSCTTASPGSAPYATRSILGCFRSRSPTL